MHALNHYVYLLSSRDETKYYIGVRSCKCLISEDSYMGSSKYVKVDNCNKIILARFNSREEAVAYEIKLHKQFDVAKNPLFWNRSKQTSTGYDRAGVPCPEYQKKIISEKLKNRIFTDEHKQKLSKAAKRSREYSKGSLNSQAKAVQCVTTGEIFPTVTEAAKVYGIKSATSISSVCHGKRKHAGNLNGKPLQWKHCLACT